MSLTENSSQLFLPGGCNRTQNLRFGPYTIDSILELCRTFPNGPQGLHQGTQKLRALIIAEAKT